MLCVLLQAPAGLAQTIGTTTGAAEGRVVDATGAVLRGVIVTAAGDALLVPIAMTSAPDGSYFFPTLPPGRYVLTFALDGFETERREGILVSLGVTTTVNVTLGPATLQQAVTVEGGAAVVDRRSTMISTVFDAGELDRLPGNRTLAAILAAAPAVQLTRFDVGGSTAFAPGPWSAYGTSGYSVPIIEGISVPGSNPPGWLLDYGTFANVSIGTGAFGPEAWCRVSPCRSSPGPVGIATRACCSPATRPRLEGHNIDDSRIKRGAPVAGGLPASETNRLLQYHDVNGDIGGYVLRDRMWCTRRRATTGRRHDRSASQWHRSITA